MLELATKGDLALADGTVMPLHKKLQQLPAKLKALTPGSLHPGEEPGLIDLAEVGLVVGVQPAVAKTPKLTPAVSVSS